ncbi:MULTISPECIES: GNAT family N-acetyltransferase [Subtercola]|uniref:GNAT family N-acetyltransferase n=1 Tax=Subtercola vilae TaxID=2056433 RepID=A0A4T2C3V2_9MICO|nr:MULTISPECIES: GNAT family N-acetyltransferase [Subtercola]MEA9987191.1 GNAT family N-acetyltransferase [Subtercola sp. RTI3]TIH38727.1 GNAT family N-acetyltransferase [Subtercola vilae]
MTIAVRPLPEAQITPWIESETLLYAAERMANGESADASAEKARLSREENFPNDRPLASHTVLQVVSDGSPVGILWLGPRDSLHPDEWWVFSIDIDAEHQGKGFGRAAMGLAETVARERGARTLGLNVFGNNPRAQNLYRSLDYTVTAMQMSKEL